ncbi:MAG: hypothetical protein QXT73_01615 [Candidatus Methanomethylicaceae archaeon]
MRMIEIEPGVLEFVRGEADKLGIKKPVVLIMDCGCMMNEGSVELDIKEEGPHEGYELYTEIEGIKFYIKPKVRKSAEGGRIGVKTYGAGRFKRLEFYPASCPR